MKATPQLFICLSNGHTYQFSVLLLLSGISIDNLGAHLCLQASNNFTNMHIIDLKGETQLAISEKIEEEDEIEALRKTELQKENSQHSLPSDHTEDAIVSSTATSITSNNSSSISFTNMTSKRMMAFGKPEYRQQDNPHFIICVSSTAVHVYLSGFNVKLFSKVFKEVTIAQSEIVQKHSKWEKKSIAIFLFTKLTTFYRRRNLLVSTL